MRCAPQASACILISIVFLIKESFPAKPRCKGGETNTTSRSELQLRICGPFCAVKYSLTPAKCIHISAMFPSILGFPGISLWHQLSKSRGSSRIPSGHFWDSSDLALCMWMLLILRQRTMKKKTTKNKNPVISPCTPNIELWNRERTNKRHNPLK